MKNKSLIFFLILAIFIGFSNYVRAEDFIFEGDYIEFKDNGNIVEATNGVQITTSNKIKITANQSVYNKLNSELVLMGNVIFYDNEKEIKI